MRVQHLFDIYAKLYMPAHHLEFYIGFFYVSVTCSVLWCVVCGILAAASISIKASVCLPVCPSVSAFANSFHYRLPWYVIRWFETACGSQIFEVICQISRSHSPKNFVKRVKFRVFGHFRENAWGRVWNLVCWCCEEGMINRKAYWDINIQETCFAANTQDLCHIICHSRGGISIIFQISWKSCVHILIATLLPCIIEFMLSCGHHICHTESYLHLHCCRYQSWSSKHVFWIKLSSCWAAYE